STFTVCTDLSATFHRQSSSGPTTIEWRLQRRWRSSRNRVSEEPGAVHSDGEATMVWLIGFLGAGLSSPKPAWILSPTRRRRRWLGARLLVTMVSTCALVSLGASDPAAAAPFGRIWSTNDTISVPGHTRLFVDRLDLDQAGRPLAFAIAAG